MKIKNVKVYGLEESIIRSGYPTQVGEPETIDDKCADLKHWLYHKNFYKIIDRLDYIPEVSNKTDILWHRKALNEIYVSSENNCAIINLRNNSGEVIYKTLIDYEDILLLGNQKFSMRTSGYATNSEGVPLHKLLINAPVVDHINRDRLDNRRINLRASNPSENNQNSSLSINNNSGVIGVNYRKDRGKWRAFIMYNYKQISLGNFTSFKSAVKARLLGELHYFKQNSPQMHLLEEYNIINPYILTDAEYIPSLYEAINNYKRILKLSNTKNGSGHDCALKGVHVTFDLQYPEYFSPQLQRYNWIDIVSSQSKMHRITSRILTDEDFTESVDDSVIDLINQMILEYKDYKLGENSQKIMFNRIISNLPSGYLKWMGISTNYLQLKTIWNQRCKYKHKLKEWEEFGEFIKTLPMSELITNKK